MFIMISIIRESVLENHYLTNSGSTGLPYPSGSTGLPHPSGSTMVQHLSGSTGLPQPSGSTMVPYPSGYNGLAPSSIVQSSPWLHLRVLGLSTLSQASTPLDQSGPSFTPVSPLTSLPQAPPWSGEPGAPSRPSRPTVLPQVCVSSASSGSPHLTAPPQSP